MLGKAKPLLGYALPCLAFAALRFTLPLLGFAMQGVAFAELRDARPLLCCA
jgi:hypothetical protein